MANRVDAAEIVVRFAGTLLEVTQLRRGETYRIGTAPEVDLPLEIAPLTSFALVGSTATGFTVRCPAGVPAVRCTRDHTTTVEGELVLAEGARLELAFGRVQITISPVAGTPVPLERRGVERRPLPFLAASLVMHVVVVLLAMHLAELGPIEVPRAILDPVRRPTRLARFDVPEVRPPRRTKRPAPSAQAAAAAAPRPDAGTTPAAAPRTGTADGAGWATLGDLGSVMGTVNLARALADVGPLYDEEAANKNNFGNGGGRFDPSSDPAFDSVKVGRYATVSTGRGAGAHYALPGEVPRPPVMALTCDDSACVVAGTMDRFKVRDVIEQRYVDLVACYERHVRALPRVELTLHFAIGPAGRASGLRIDGHVAVGGCVARIVEHAKFPVGDRPTEVTYPMAFWRTTPS